MKRLFLFFIPLIVLMIGIGCSGSVGNDPITVPSDGSADNGSNNESGTKVVVGTFEPDPLKDFDFSTDGFKLHIPAEALTTKFKVTISRSPSTTVQNSLPSGMSVAGNLFNVLIEPVSTSSNIVADILGATTQLIFKKPAKVTLILSSLRNENTDYFIGNRTLNQWSIISPASNTSIEMAMQTFNPQGDFCIFQRLVGVAQSGLKDFKLTLTPTSLVSTNSGVFGSDIVAGLKLTNFNNSSLTLSSSQIQMYVYSLSPFELELKNDSTGTTKFASSITTDGKNRITFSMVNQSYIEQINSGNVASLSFRVALSGKTLAPLPSSWQFKAIYNNGDSLYVAENSVNFSANATTTSPATVLATIPAKNSTSIGVGTEISIAFDKAISSSSVNTDSIKIEIADVAVSGSYQVNEKEIRFKPAVDLPYAAEVTIEVTSDVTDTLNNPVKPYSFSFSTITRPDVAPTVVAHTPTMLTGIPISQQIQATFSKLMNKASVTSAFKVTRISDSSIVNGNFSWSTDNLTVVFIPTSSLAYNATYSVSVGVGAIDTDGIPLSSASTWQFLTEPAPAEQTYVTSATPLNDSSNVSVSTPIEMVFSRALKSETVTADNLKISVNGLTISGVFVCSSDRVTFTPTTSFPHNALVKVEIQSGILDIEDRAVKSYFFSYTTDSQPEILAYSPLNVPGINIAITQPIEVTFSKAMNTGQTASAFNVKKVDDQSQINGSVSWGQGNKTMIFLPSSSLDYNATYSVEIGESAADVDGNTLAASLTWQFLTEPIPAEQAYVVSTAPLNDTNDATISTPIDVTFSRNVKADTVDSNSFLVSINGLQVAGTYTTINDKVTFLPNQSFPYNSLVKVEIRTSLQDPDARAVKPYFFSFLTVSQPEILAYSPINVAGVEIAVNDPVEVTFSKTMDTAQTSTAFQMKKTDDQSLINGSFSWGQVNKKMIFLPSSSLSYNATYSVEVEEGASDVDGNSLAASLTWEFITTAGNLPSFVNEPSVSRISQNTASATCEIALENGAEISQKGFVWNTSQNPTLESCLDKTEAGAGIGVMNDSLGALSAGTLYYLRAYATSAAGTNYSAEKSFSTYVNTGGSGGLFAGGDGSETNPFQIGSVAQLNNIQNGSGSSYIITSDFTVSSGDAGRTATFTGKLNGNGFEIANNSPSPLLGRVDYTSELANLVVNAAPEFIFSQRYGAIADVNYGSINNCKVSINTLNTDLSSTSDVMIGCIVAGNLGKIKSCSAEGEIKYSADDFLVCGGIAGYCATGSEIINADFTGAIDAITIYGTGGITGWNRGGIIVNSIASSSIVTSSAAFTAGSGGGISGANNGYISSCKAYGTIASGSIGTLTYFGGIVGDNTGGTIVDCENNTNIPAESGN